MKFKFFLIIAVVLTAFLSSCDDEETEIGNWVTKAYYDGFPRGEGSSFALNGKGYFGMGKDESDYLSDFWMYDPDKNTWSQKSNFPGTPRAYNISIATETKAYVGLGYDGDNDLADMWEYDAATDKWTQIADFPGGKRIYATAFSIGNDIYVGTGHSRDTKKNYNDFWKYSNGAWEIETGDDGIIRSKVSSNPGQKRYKSNSIGFNGKGYLISGFDNSVLSDFWEYDPTNNNWTKLTNTNDEDTGNTGVARTNASTFVSEGKIFLACGSVSSTPTTTIFEWAPSSGEWTSKTSLESSAREGAGCFVINGKGYIVGGHSGNSYFYDCYTFNPSEEKVSDD